MFMYVVGKNFGGIHTGLTVVSNNGVLYGVYIDESIACHMVASFLKQGMPTIEKTVGKLPPVNVFDI